MTKPRLQTVLNRSSLVIILGKYYLKRQWSSPSIQERDVERISVHPKYNAQSFSNDIAIVKMSSPIEITDYVRPICLWEGDLHLQAVVNKTGNLQL